MAGREESSLPLSPAVPASEGIKAAVAAPWLPRPPSAEPICQPWWKVMILWVKMRFMNVFMSYSSCEFGKVVGICEKPKTMTVTWKEFGWNNPLNFFFLSGCILQKTKKWNGLQNVRRMSTTLCPTDWLSCLIWQDINHLCQ